MNDSESVNVYPIVGAIESSYKAETVLKFLSRTYPNGCYRVVERDDSRAIVQDLPRLRSTFFEEGQRKSVDASRAAATGFLAGLKYCDVHFAHRPTGERPVCGSTFYDEVSYLIGHVTCKSCLKRAKKRAKRV